MFIRCLAQWFSNLMCVISTYKLVKNTEAHVHWGRRRLFVLLPRVPCDSDTHQSLRTIGLAYGRQSIYISPLPHIYTQNSWKLIINNLKEINFNLTLSFKGQRSGEERSYAEDKSILCLLIRSPRTEFGPDGRVEGRGLTPYCGSTGITINCWTIIDRRTLKLTKKRCPTSKDRGEASVRR